MKRRKQGSDVSAEVKRKGLVSGEEERRKLRDGCVYRVRQEHRCESDACRLQRSGTKTTRFCSECVRFIHDVCNQGESAEVSQCFKDHGVNVEGEVLSLCSKTCASAFVRRRFPSAKAAGGAKPSTAADELHAPSDDVPVGDDGEVTFVKETAADDTEPVDSSIAVSDFKIGDYRVVQVRVKLERIEEPVNATRDVSSAHQAAVDKLMDRLGYVPSIGSLAVTLKRLPNGEKPCGGGLDVVVDEELCYTVVLVDGRHRVVVLRGKAESSPRWRELVKNLTVALWIRKDGELLSSMEVLALGAHLNALSGTVLPSSVRDHMYAAVSTVRTLIHDAQGATWDTLTSSQLGGVLIRGRTLGMLKQRQAMRYAKIALRLARHPEALQVFLNTYDESGGRMGVVHLDCEVLLETCGQPVFSFLLRALKMRIIAANDGRFDQYRDLFFEAALSLYREVERMCDQRGLLIADVMDKVVPAGVSSAERSVCDLLCVRIAKCSFREETEAASSKRRVDAVRKKLEETVLPPIPQVSSAAVSSPAAAAAAAAEGEAVSDAVVAGAGGDEVPPVITSVSSGTNAAVAKPLERTGAGAAAGAVQTRESSRRRASARVRKAAATSVSAAPSATPGGRVRKQRRQRRAPRASAVASQRRTSEKTVLERRLEAMSSTAVCSLFRRLGYKLARRGDMQDDGDAQEEDGESKGSEGDEDGFEAANDEKFNDAVSPKPPSSFRSPPDYEGPDNPMFARLVVKSPRLWKASLVKHVQPLLTAVHIPVGHRSHLALSVEDVRRNHHVVWWRAAYSHFKKLGGWEDIGSFVGIDAGDTNESKMWAAALEWPEEGAVYFAQRRSELLERGWCVLDGFMADHTLPEEVVVSQPSYVREAVADVARSSGDTAVQSDALPIAKLSLRSKYSRSSEFQRLQRLVVDAFPDLEDRVRQPEHVHWTWIVNRGAAEDRKQGCKGVGRYMSKHSFVTESLEEGDAWACRARALQDARVGQAVSCLKLDTGSRSSDGSSQSPPVMAVPHTGGRWLVTVKGCERQTLHSDFPVTPDVALRDEGNPGFFTVTTGQQEVPLWVCPRSHRQVGRVIEERRSAFLRSEVREHEVEKVMISPHSILVARGDMQHCGAAFADAEEEESGDALVRYHMYFVPAGVQLPDGVHREKTFKPRFPSVSDSESESDEQDEQHERDHSDDGGPSSNQRNDGDADDEGDDGANENEGNNGSGGDDHSDRSSSSDEDSDDAGDEEE